MDITDYDKIEIEFEEYSIMLPNSIIEKFQVDKEETLIEKKYNPEDKYNIYITINRILAEKLWKEEGLRKFERNIRQEFMGIFIFARQK